jgi:CO dehydrogenase maturation factor
MTGAQATRDRAGAARQATVPLRVAVIGKGGAGKSMIAGTMARLIARQGVPVLALDSDPVPGLSLTLGSGPDPVRPPLVDAARQDEQGQWGWSEGITAAIAAQRFATDAPDGVRLLQRGKPEPKGSRAILPASKAFWEVVHGLVDAPEFQHWALIGDLPAGPYQVADDWAPYAHHYLVVVQPTLQSAMTARRVARLARMRTPGAAVRMIANRVRDEDDVRHVEKLVREPVFAAVPADEDVAAAERLGQAPVDAVPDSAAIAAIGQLIARLSAGE